jgi:glycosyltransferase involved in cell wall biosynthesis
VVGAAGGARARDPLTSGFHTNFHRYCDCYGVGWLKPLIARLLRRFHNRTGCTLVPTAALRDELARQGFRNLRVVARGIDANLFSPKRRSDALRASWGAAPADPVALYVGRLAPEKSVPLACEAFRAMRAAVPQARLVVVGDGPGRAALEQSAAPAVFAGMRVGTDLAAHYASADIFLFPSQTETYGNVTVEAMASGLAVVAFEHAAAAQHIRHGWNGIAVPVGDATGFVNHAAALATDRARIARIGARARASAESLDWERVVVEFENALVDAVLGAVTNERTARVPA